MPSLISYVHSLVKENIQPKLDLLTVDVCRTTECMKYTEGVFSVVKGLCLKSFKVISQQEN